MKESWELIARGGAEEFVDTLCAEATDHPAVDHAYLERMASGDLPDVTWALRDYAYQYAFYSGEFTRYLEGVIATLTSAEHRATLRENLEEELGDPAGADPERVPHTELFERFRRAVGVDADYVARHKPITTVEVWRDLALQKCHSPQLGVGIGAIGIGTEYVVPRIYTYFLEGIRRHTSLTEDDFVFFSLHAVCDQAHAADLRRITVDIAEEPANREAIRFGVFSALNLRKAFWDIMLSRAIEPSREA